MFEMYLLQFHKFIKSFIDGVNIKNNTNILLPSVNNKKGALRHRNAPF
jgi:hypothetical protein